MAGKNSRTALLEARPLLGTITAKRGEGTVTFALWLAGVIIVSTSALASAQDQVIERTVKVSSGKAVRVGVYVNLKPDCTSGPLPSIKLISSPEHGKVTVKQATVNATNYKQCLAVQVPGFVALYQAAPQFSGVDSISLEIKTPGGRTVVQKITLTVGGPSQPI
jgi:hypothetical protein